MKKLLSHCANAYNPPMSRWARRCSTAVVQLFVEVCDEANARQQRGLTQQLYLLNKSVKRCDGAVLCATYAMQGATNRVYDVCVQVGGALWTCMCLDFLQHHCNCKHIYFVRDCALAPSVSALLRNAVVATEDACCQYRQAKHARLSHLSDKGDAPTLAVKQLIEGRMCPICLDDLDEAAQLVFCNTCGNAAHTKCYNMWTATDMAHHRGNSKDWVATCVYCWQTMFFDQAKTVKSRQPQLLAYIEIDNDATSSSSSSNESDNDNSSSKSNTSS